MINTTPAILRHPSLTSYFCTLLLLCLLLIAEKSAAADNVTGYSIVLASAPGKNLDWKLQEKRLFNGLTVYIEKTVVKGSSWERLCVGFFKQRSQAVSLRNKIQKIYPGSWIQKASSKNIVSTISSPTSQSKPVNTAVTASRAKRTALPSSSSLSEKQLDSLMQRAKSDFKNKKYSSSIRYFKALIAAGEHKYSREALELSGLARQRKGQTAHAVDTYKKYLALYPDAEGSVRVRQRLAGLLTATRAPREDIRMTTTDKKNQLTTHGSLAQYYQNNRTSFDGIGSMTTLSQLITFLDSTSLQRTASFDHRFKFTSDHVFDFIDNSDDSQFRFIETYYELSHRKTGTSGRLGRQTLRTGGILRRFDGISAGYQFTPDMRLNVVGGFPVDIDNKTSINKDKTFYGFTFETGTFLQHWSMNLFYFDQQSNGIQDLHTLGSDVRYRDRKKSFFGMIDYDLLYDEITVLQLNADIRLNYDITAYINAYRRKTPLLATSNALIGRQEQSLEELKKVLNIEQIYQLARDRTASSETITLGGSQQLNEKYQLTADITFSHTGDTVASGGVAATPDTGTDYFLSTQLVANSLLMKSDTAIFGVRYYDSDLADTFSFIVNSRFPVSRHWRVNPRLQFDIRQLNDGNSQKKLRALFRTDYRYSNKVLFDFDIGYDETFENAGEQDLANNSLYFLLGYRWDF